MANIILTSYCNLHCPYCFANEMINTEEIKNISIAQFQHILDWISKTPLEGQRIGLIGGEPTLHPQFDEILDIVGKFCLEHNCFSILFTNGIYINKFLSNIPSKMVILLNFNIPTAMTPQQWESLNINIEKMHKIGWLYKSEDIKNAKVTIGCNLCLEITDYSFFWDTIDKYPGIPEVRMSVTSPINPVYKVDKDLYYTSMKPVLLEFVEQANKRNISISADCNQIPICYFTEEEFAKLYNMNRRGKVICEPIIDITPDFQASSCFGAYDLVDCNEFETISDLHRHLLYKKVAPKVLNNRIGRCENCKLFDLTKCQGGCLGFAKLN